MENWHLYVELICPGMSSICPPVSFSKIDPIGKLCYFSEDGSAHLLLCVVLCADFVVVLSVNSVLSQPHFLSHYYLDQSRFRGLVTLGHLGPDNSLLCEAVLCGTGCLAVPLAFTHWMPLVFPQL